MHQHANSDVTADFIKVLDLLEELDSQRLVKELAAIIARRSWGGRTTNSNCSRESDRWTTFGSDLPNLQRLGKDHTEATNSGD